MCICVYTYIHIYDLCTHEFYVSIYREKYPQIACMCVYPPACKLSMCIIWGLYIITHIHLSIAIGKILKASRSLVQSLSYVNSVMVLC